MLVCAVAFLGSSSSCKKEYPTEAAESVADKPRIVLSESEHDFGSVTEGETIKHTLTVKNNGKVPLIIERVRTSCECVIATNKDKEIQPGASSEIEVSFDTTRRPGKNSQTIVIQSNDKDNASTRFTLRAVVDHLLAFQPQMLRIDLNHNEEKKEDVWLVGKLSKDARLVIEDIRGDTGATAEIIQKTEGEETTTGIRVKVKGSKLGRATGVVRVKTGIESMPELNFQFDTSVTGNIKLSPRALVFDPLTAGKDRVLTVTSTRADFKITATKVVEGPYGATFKKTDDGAGFEVTVKLTAADENELRVLIENADQARKDKTVGSLSGKLEIVSNDPLEPKLEVPIQWRRSPGAGRPRVSPSNNSGGAVRLPPTKTRLGAEDEIR